MTSTNKISNHFFKNQAQFLKENFTINDEKLFFKFNMAVERFCYFVLEMDKIIDGEYNFVQQFSNKENRVYDVIDNHQKALKLLWDIFPDGHEFWNDLDKTSKRYYHILTKEKYENVNKTIFSIDNFKEYAIAKHCLAYIPIKGLSYLFEHKVDAKKMESIFTEIFLGMQMNDDIEDFNSDLDNKQWTYAHSLVEEFMIENQVSENSGLDKFRERVFYVSGIGENLTKYSKERFISAKEMCEKYNLKMLENWLDNIISTIAQNENLILKLTAN